MSKNNKLIESMRQTNARLREQIFYEVRDQVAFDVSQEIIPHLYAAFALCLSREYKWDFDQLNHLFYLTQELWENTDMLTLVQECDEETGILLLNPEQYEKYKEEQEC